MVWQITRGRVGRVVSPPEQIAEVKAVACEPPAHEGVALSRRSVADVHRLVIQRGISEASVSTIVRWLRQDAIRPWQYRSWIFPTDPEFAVKAGRILDLYQGRWEGELLHPGDMIISADEKPSIQARGRIAETLPPRVADGVDLEEVLVDEPESDHPRGQLDRIGDPRITRQRVHGQRLSRYVTDQSGGVIRVQDHLDDIADCALQQLHQFP